MTSDPNFHNHNDRPLSHSQAREVKGMAELEVRRFFDYYLREVFPDQVNRRIDAHDKDPAAHGGVEKKANKFFWTIIGAAGAAGAGVTTVIQAVFAA